MTPFLPPEPGPRVVLIDDDPLIHALVGAMLKPLNVRIASASSGAEGLAAARREPTDVMLLDNDMPGASGLEVLAHLKADPLLSSVPVIMQTGREETLAACFAAGAVDYIRKPFTGVELRARVGSVLERQRLMIELRNAAQTDKLTGLANRTLLNLRLTEALARAAGSEQYRFSLLFLDFDGFKYINDTLGHEVGDQLLQAIAGRLQANLRVTGAGRRSGSEVTIARFGGDEFVAVLDGVNTPELVYPIAERLLDALGAPYQLGAQTVRSTASIGIVFGSREYETAKDVVRDADIAMYEAKARGRARYVAFTSDMRESVRERHELENDLRAALGTSQLSLEYQPIVSLEDRTVCGVECRLRWTHPTHGDVASQAFIPVAEESRLIIPLNEWMLRTACEDFAHWHAIDGDGAPAYLSVNLSGMHFSQAHLVENMLCIVKAAGLEPHQLQVEVTEAQVVQNRSIGLEVLGEFRSRGVRLAMDGFGTAYSTLFSLHEFPFDVLKLDEAFIASASSGHHFAALLHAVITLADNLGLKVIAEGVETEEQLVLLQALGCTYGQGALLARPMSALHIAEQSGAAVAALS